MAARVYIDQLDLENFSVPAMNCTLSIPSCDVVIWYEPDDNDVIVPRWLSYEEDMLIEGMKFDAVVAQNGFFVTWSGPGKEKGSFVATSHWDLNKKIEEVSIDKVTKRVPFEASYWDDCAEDMRNVQLKLNVAEKAN